MVLIKELVCQFFRFYVSSGHEVSLDSHFSPITGFGPKIGAIEPGLGGVWVFEHRALPADLRG